MVQRALPPERRRTVDPASPSPRSLRRRITLGTIATLMAGGAAVSSLGILAHPIPSSHRAKPTLIRGERALRPDLLREVSWPFVDESGTPAVRETKPAEHPGSPGARALITPTRSAVELVRGFCLGLDASPASAVRMIAADLLGPDRAAEVVRSWEQADSVHLRALRALPGDAVLAELLTVYTDGTRLHLRYLFTVGGDDALIDGAELLTAIRHHG